VDGIFAVVRPVVHDQSVLAVFIEPSRFSQRLHQRIGIALVKHLGGNGGVAEHANIPGRLPQRRGVPKGLEHAESEWDFDVFRRANLTPIPG
jgi:hypothetical protein